MKPRHRALARCAAAWLACALAAGPGLAQPVSSSRVPLPAIEAARGEACVADPAFMRRNHMDLLKHRRDETVHRGVRDARASLKGCIECHASAATRSVAQAPGDFCASCHGYAAVKIDCFECHSSKPATTALPASPPKADTGTLRPQLASAR